MKQVSRVNSMLSPLILIALMGLGNWACSNEHIPENTSEISHIPTDGTYYYYSNFVRDTFKVYYHLPSGYNNSDSEEYPVIYLLDGDWYFDGSHWRIDNGGVVGIATELIPEHTMPDVIIIGIGYTSDTQRGRDFLQRYNNFYSFLQNELIPHIDETYRTDILKGRTLIGHSDGGYFTLHCAFKYSNSTSTLFEKFISISGDFTKPYIDLYQEEEDMFIRISNDSVYNVSMYLAVGGLEEDRFVSSFQNMSQRLLNRNYKKFAFRNILFSNYNHGTVVKPAITNGLTWIFKDDLTLK